MQGQVLRWNYILAPEAWKVLGRMSPLPLWSRHLCVHRVHTSGRLDAVSCTRYLSVKFSMT